MLICQYVRVIILVHIVQCLMVAVGSSLSVSLSLGVGVEFEFCMHINCLHPVLNHMHKALLDPVVQSLFFKRPRHPTGESLWSAGWDVRSQQ
jgi:hypothetical protein